jgi:hypothetical protein
MVAFIYLVEEMDGVCIKSCCHEEVEREGGEAVPHHFSLQLSRKFSSQKSQMVS